VTADGRVVRTDEAHEPDLFWALRGGGGNFGVVTNIEYELFPVGPEIVGGRRRLARRGRTGRPRDVHAPPEFTCVAALRLAPPAPWLPKEVHGTPIVALFVCDTGPLDEARERAAALKSFGSPVGDVLQPRPYLQQQALLDATQPNGRRYYWKSEFLPVLEPAFLDACQAALARITSPHSAILLFPLAGALNELAEDHSAVGSRDSMGVVNIAAAWDDGPGRRPHGLGARRLVGDPARRNAVQATTPVFLDLEATLEKACDLIAEAGRNGARLAVFPEGFLPSYPFWSWFIPAYRTMELRVLYDRLLQESVTVPGPVVDRLGRPPGRPASPSSWASTSATRRRAARRSTTPALHRARRPAARAASEARADRRRAPRPRPGRRQRPRVYDLDIGRLRG
jgi:hypothetical protein